MEEQQRLQKYISECGIMSRRAAEEEILKGHFTVNGETAQLGCKVVPKKDTVLYRGREIKSEKSRDIYIMLNKPRGYVTTLSDEKGRHIVTELTRDIEERIYPVGRLDMDSEGLLILTNDGELTNILTHPGHEVGKVYHVKVDSEIDSDTLKKFRMPMQIDGYDLKPVDVEIITRKNGYTMLRMELFEGRNRQIRKMCESLGLNVLSLVRISIGPISLGNLPTGKWRYLTKSQVQSLKRGYKNVD